jgi:tetratricopeptide (TPR) repeat protein
MKVFLSCVSTEFKSYRLKLANQLGALKDHPAEVKVQEDFQQGGFTLLEKLADYIRECDLVIHLAGDACGARPTAEHELTVFHSLGDTPPDPLPGLSYTQWEYRFGLRFERNTLVYLAAPETPRDCALPVPQTDEEARLQQSHLQAIRQSGKHRAAFNSYNTLVREVFHDLGLEPERKINNLPYKSLGSLFKGRDNFLSKIHDTLGRAELHGFERSATISAPATAVAIYGLGGSGKTRVAIEYALHYADEYTALLFVRADSRAGLQQNLAALSGDTALDLPQKDEPKIEAQMAAVLQWLQQHAAWLMIFDNADTEEAAHEVQDRLGELTLSGQVLVTSRLANWPSAIGSVSLESLTEADAAAFLLERTQDRRRKTSDDDAQARAVGEDLGQLPLALEQAGAYIDKYRLTFADYLAEWQGQRDKVLTWFDERLMQYPMSVAVTWQTSFDSLSEPARRLLHILSWLAPDPIPESLLQAGGGPFAMENADQPKTLPDAREALADLDAHSLVTRADESPLFSVHRLVQDVTRGSELGNGGQPYLTAALRWLDAVFVSDPSDVRTWPVLVPLAPHALAVARRADTVHIIEPTVLLMNKLGTLYRTQAQYADAEPLMRRVVEIYKEACGPDHPNVAAGLDNLAVLLRDTNRLGEAEPLMRRALAIDEKVYGPNHPNVASSLNNLATVLYATNQLEEAEPVMRRALAIDEKAYGPDHLDVARDLNNLAELLRFTDRSVEAEPLLRRVLAIDEKVYGPDHPKVAIVLNNLALVLRATNRIAEAEPLMRRVLAIDEKSYGPEHPNVARDLNNLAVLLRNTSRLVEAEPLMWRALAIDEKSFGPDHPNVAIRLDNLALLMQDTDRLGDAEPLLRRVVEILAKFRRDTGREHEHFGAILDQYVTLLTHMGYREEQVLAKLNEVVNRYGLSLGA